MQNPWLDRFEGLLDQEEIRRRATVLAKPIAGLRDMPSEIARIHYENALENIYIPTEQGCEILRIFVEIAIAHSMMRYPSIQDFRSQCFGEIKNPKYRVGLTCFSGLSGVGKTKLLAALRRVLPPFRQIHLDPRDSEYPLCASWHINVVEKTSLKDLLVSILRENGLTEFSSNRISGLLSECFEHAYRSGTSLLVVDETQFITNSSEASTLITKVLLRLLSIKVPIIFASNFTLLGNLLNRQNQERRRLVDKTHVLLPEEPDSHSWKKLISEYIRVAPGLLTITPEGEGELLHDYSAGIKEYSANLIGIAYRFSRDRNSKTIDRSDIEKAYISPKYMAQRNDVETLKKQAITNTPTKGREDLWCPIPTPPPVQAAVKARAEQQYGERAALARLLAAALPEELEAFQAVLGRRLQEGDHSKSTSNVVPIKRNKKPTFSELLESARAFRQEIEKGD